MSKTCSDTCNAIAAQPLLRKGLWLLGFTISYNVIEGVIAVWFGNSARSTALITFGLDSGIECAAAGVLFWRLLVELRHQTSEHTETAEKRAHQLVGLTFLLLAGYVLIEAGGALLHHEAPSTSLVGIILTILSLGIMPTLAYLKLKTAKKLGSKALMAEAKETIACSWLSAITLGGLAANATLGWWWADPIAGLCMLPWLIREGLEGLRGEGCTCD